MLRKIRKNRRIPATEVASKLKISRDRLSRIENGKSPLPVEFLPTLSRIYSIPKEELLNMYLRGDK